MASPPQRAERVRKPAVTDALKASDRVREAALREGEAREKRSVVRGLILLALLLLLVSIARAGLGRVFVHGWWRL